MKTENFFQPNSSTDYYDELAWAAVWLYKATGKQDYLENAEARLSQSEKRNEESKTFDWDDKRVGVNILLAQITNKYVRKCLTKCGSKYCYCKI